MAGLKLGVLISGRGSNLQALVEAARETSYPAEIVLVISNNPDAAGLRFAADAGIAHETVSHGDFADRAAFDDALDRKLRQAGVELVCLSGFMRVLSPGICDAWRDRLINIHPSLLPSFPGLDAQAQALAAGVRVTGTTVHFVRAEVDDGPIIAQAAVPVLSGDNLPSLSARILKMEHRVYPLAVRLIAEGRVRRGDDRVDIDNESAALGVCDPA